MEDRVNDQTTARDGTRPSESEPDASRRARRRLLGRCGIAAVAIAGLGAFSVGAVLAGVFDGTNVSPAALHRQLVTSGASNAAARLPSLPGGTAFALARHTSARTPADDASSNVGAPPGASVGSGASTSPRSSTSGAATSSSPAASLPSTVRAGVA
ncbi:MAG: hypothetical protein ACRDWE_04400, partial [Acidimicrobiales bacterium]